MAVIHGCNAGFLREALREVCIPRIQRENSYFAANVLGARGTLVSVLGQFFENGWESPVVKGTEEHSLSEERRALHPYVAFPLMWRWIRKPRTQKTELRWSAT